MNEQKLNEIYMKEPWAKLLAKWFKWEPCDVESSSRKVAERAALEIDTLEKEIIRLNKSIGDLYSELQSNVSWNN